MISALLNVFLDAILGDALGDRVDPPLSRLAAWLRDRMSGRVVLLLWLVAIVAMRGGDSIAQGEFSRPRALLGILLMAGFPATALVATVMWRDRRRLARRRTESAY